MVDNKRRNMHSQAMHKFHPWRRTTGLAKHTQDMAFLHEQDTSCFTELHSNSGWRLPVER